MLPAPPKDAVKERFLRRRHGLAPVDFPELWRYRELFLFLAWRDVLIRYKQTYLGIAWAVLQPLLTTVVFSVLFGGIAKFDTHGAPYPILTLAALLPWSFFANALGDSSNSLVASSNLISKIYFPRLIVPASSVLSGLMDFLVALVLLFLLMAWYHVAFTPHLLLLPVFFLIGALAALASGIWLSALNVKYRDVKYVVPFFTRIGLYVSPVGFPSYVIPERWRFWYDLNPLVGVIDGFRWCVLGPAFQPHWPALLLNIVIILVVLVTGVFYFRGTEKTFADVI